MQPLEKMLKQQNSLNRSSLPNPTFFFINNIINLNKLRNVIFFFTSESVSEGHPDKVSDQISDTFR